jgi:hypothetical protein
MGKLPGSGIISSAIFDLVGQIVGDTQEGQGHISGDPLFWEKKVLKANVNHFTLFLKPSSGSVFQIQAPQCASRASSLPASPQGTANA